MARLPFARTLKGRKRYLAVSAIAVSAILWGCERPPHADHERALQALEEARSAGAEKWAAAEFAGARDLLEAGERELGAQAGRFAWNRSYTRAREIFVAARDDAAGARESGEKEKARAREEAEQAVGRTRTALSGAKAALQIAPSPRDGRSEMARLKGELQSVERQIADLDRLIGSEEYAAASDRAGDLSARIQKALSRFFNSIESQANHNGHSR